MEWRLEHREDPISSILELGIVYSFDPSNTIPDFNPKLDRLAYCKIAKGAEYEEKVFIDRIECQLVYQLLPLDKRKATLTQPANFFRCHGSTCKPIEAGKYRDFSQEELIALYNRIKEKAKPVS